MGDPSKSYSVVYSNNTQRSDCVKLQKLESKGDFQDYCFGEDVKESEENGIGNWRKAGSIKIVAGLFLTVL